MKASEVLRRYAAGERDFRRVNLRGQDLSGADFSNADIRGTNFTKANLRGANFDGAQAGLPNFVKIALVMVLMLVAAFSGITLALASISTKLLITYEVIERYSIVPVVMIGILWIFFPIITICKGLETSIAFAVVAGVFAVSIAVAQSGTASEVWYGVMAGVGVIVGLVISAGVVASALTVAGVVAVAVILVMVVIFTITPAVILAKTMAVNVAVAMTVAITPLATYMGLQALAGNHKYISLNRIAITFAAIGGTSFRYAYLTDANFTGAILKNSNLDEAILIRTCFYNAKKVYLAKVGGTYLSYPNVRRLVVKRKTQQKNLNRLDLRGVYLAGVNLADFSFVGTNLSEANLQDADLSRAKLVQTQLYGTDLTGANLTAATIEDWGITSHTKLHGVRCGYIFMRETTFDDPNPRRKPDNWEETFKDGEFSDFITPILKTLDLYHNQGVNPRAIAIAYRQLVENHPEADLQIVAMELRGNNKDKFLLRVETSETTSNSELNREYFGNYNQLKSLPTDHLLLLLAEKDNQISRLEKMIGTAISPHSSPIISSANKQQNKSVFLILGARDEEKGFPSVMAQIWLEDVKLLASCQGSLPPETEIIRLYQQWKKIYAYQSSANRQLKRPKDNLTDISPRQLHQVSQDLQRHLNTWLSSEGFRKIADILREKLNESDPIRIIIQTENIELQRLPWHLWNFFDSYRSSEVAWSSQFGVSTTKAILHRNKIRILAIMGNSEGIDVEEDRRVLENLPNAETEFLVEPKREELNQHLWNEEGWDILCFSGHSESTVDGSAGVINLNATEQLTLEELRNALRKAIECGLHLAIFNSCDGFGLAQQLADLPIPQVVFMREPVPDVVAQEFLKNFLQAFSGGKSLYLAMREAREKLQGMENDFFYASWLPVIYQNSAEAPKTWQDFTHASHD
ncbi:pentapeptide repeat-containing protein [Mastigocoleus sp. MO_188.B34]|uniref:pentapeptide repeat-containing protein n=1 Tax=Mastigocoleus sp. MO_188.B34 TaxID=3036635 RepID=UPI0026198841|nr:pentapeptide repeat-containing protein [Mastigocoleus sp. MO_188.B34]MDJ0695488.1 pentapeptide repeat-containing protein [Mastigocoleus sp. MO_188.B34]